MVIDTKGNILTDLEFVEMRIKNITVDISKTEPLMKRMESLIKNLENTDTYRQIDIKYNLYMEEIKKCIPESKKEQLMKLDDCYTDILILYEEYFYKHGFIDSLNQNKGIIKRIILWVKKKLEVDNHDCQKG